MTTSTVWQRYIGGKYRGLVFSVWYFVYGVWCLVFCILCIVFRVLIKNIIRANMGTTVMTANNR